jgi:hypothetical protein
MIDPTCYDDRTDDDDLYCSDNREWVVYALIVATIALVFGFGFFVGWVAA